MTTTANKLTRRMGATSALATSVAVMLLVLLGGVSLFIWYDHDDASRDAARRTGQAARTLEEHTALSLRAVEDLIDRAAERIVDRAERPELDRLARTLRHIGSLWFFDMKGGLVYSSAGPGLAGNYADRDYFIHSSQHDGPYVGPLIRGRSVPGNFFTLSKRVSADGVPIGVVLADIEIGCWANFHESLGLHPDSVIAVFRNDGRFVARHPLHERVYDANVSATPFFRQANPAERDGVFFDTTSTTDGITRIVAYRPVPAYGLFVIASESSTAALSDWRRRAAWVAALAGIAALLIAAIGYLAWRFARLESQARASLAGQAAALERALVSSRLLHRELQHRTKNNLQLITSLLRVGKNTKEPAEAMAAAISRIAAIGRAYADLQGDEMVGRAHSRNVIGDTVHALTSGVDASRLKVDIDIADCAIPVEKAAPLALIVNEALTNALKYGVSGDATGHISVSARYVAPTLHVEVRDRGPGLPADKPQRNSTGLRIIDGLAQQIDASFELVNDGGTVFRLRVDVGPQGAAAAA